MAWPCAGASRQDVSSPLFRLSRDNKRGPDADGTALAVVNLVFLPMAMLSGLWLPIYMFPDVMQDIALALPAYHHAQLALEVIGMDGGQSVPLHVAVLIAEMLVFLAVAGLGFRRAGTCGSRTGGSATPA